MNPTSELRTLSAVGSALRGAIILLERLRRRCDADVVARVLERLERRRDLLRARETR